MNGQEPTAEETTMTPQPTAKRAAPRWVTAMLVLALLGGGIALAVLFVVTKKEPDKKEKEVSAPLVEVVRVSKGTRPVNMQLSGEVQPARRIVVMPEVSGKIVWQHDDLAPGGFFEAGETILRIDARDYALQLQQQRAQLASQRLALQMEKGRQRVAEREWEFFQKERDALGLDQQPSDKDDGKALALRKPHLASAEVSVRAAESAISQAQLKLSRTAIEAPFNAVVQAENVDIGQLVSPGSQLLTLVGTDAFWVQVSVPVDKLAWVRFPQGDQPGSKAKVWLDTGNGNINRDGRVLRLLGDLDPVGRLARLLVEVKDPLLLADGNLDVERAEDSEANLSELPLLLGSFVHVEIEGLDLDDVVEVPRLALQENDRVYLVNSDDRLEIKKVRVIWGSDQSVLVTGPLATGDRLITTNLQTAVEGMKLRPAQSSSGDPGASARKKAHNDGGAQAVENGGAGHVEPAQGQELGGQRRAEPAKAEPLRPD